MKWINFCAIFLRHTQQVLRIFAHNYLRNLLGGDNHKVFPSEDEWDSQGFALYRRNLTQNYMVYSSINHSIITWVDPINSANINTVNVKLLSIFDLQEQWLLTVSAEKYSPTLPTETNSTRTPRRRASRTSWRTSHVNKVNHKVFVQYLYDKKFSKLG